MIAYKVVRVVQDGDKERYFSPVVTGTSCVEYGIQYSAIKPEERYPLFCFNTKKRAKEFKKYIKAEYVSKQNFKIFECECKESMFIVFDDPDIIYSDEVMLIREVK